MIRGYLLEEKAYLLNLLGLKFPVHLDKAEKQPKQFLQGYIRFIAGFAIPPKMTDWELCSQGIA